MNEHETIGKQALFYKDKYKEIHVSLKRGQFYNGFVLEVGADHLELNDRKLGQVIIFFIEIDKIEPFKREVSDAGSS